MEHSKQVERDHYMVSVFGAKEDSFPALSSTDQEDDDSPASETSSEPQVVAFAPIAAEVAEAAYLVALKKYGPKALEMLAKNAPEIYEFFKKNKTEKTKVEKEAVEKGYIQRVLGPVADGFGDVGKKFVISIGDILIDKYVTKPNKISDNFSAPTILITNKPSGKLTADHVSHVERLSNRQKFSFYDNIKQGDGKMCAFRAVITTFVYYRHPLGFVEAVRISFDTAQINGEGTIEISAPTPPIVSVTSVGANRAVSVVNIELQAKMNTPGGGNKQVNIALVFEGRKDGSRYDT